MAGILLFGLMAILRLQPIPLAEIDRMHFRSNFGSSNMMETFSAVGGDPGIKLNHSCSFSIVSAPCLATGATKP